MAIVGWIKPDPQLLAALADVYLLTGSNDDRDRFIEYAEKRVPIVDDAQGVREDLALFGHAFILTDENGKRSRIPPNELMIERQSKD